MPRNTDFRGQGWGMVGTGHDLTTALQRVTFWEQGKPDEARVAMYNPNKLSIEIGYRIHEKSPVGWSGQIRQGSGTIEKPFDVELLYTQRGLRELPNVRMREDIEWLGSFCYPQDPGIGSAPFCLNWPNTYSGVGRIGNLRHEFEQWDMYLKVRRAKITLTFHPYRLSFKPAATFKRIGFHDGQANAPLEFGAGASTGPSTKKKG